MTLLDRCVAIYAEAYAEAATDGHPLPEIRRIAIAAVIDVVNDHGADADADTWDNHPSLTVEERNRSLR
jgi:hypothetical protein